MNRKMIFNTVGRIICLEAALMCLPTAVSLMYGEWRTAGSFALTVLLSMLLGGLFVLLTRRGDRTIYAREGFVVVAFAWIAMSALGALPFVLSGDIPSYIDAFFETVSGITTTGASVVVDLTAISHGGLFWRSFTHWIGGMGVLVLMMAIVPDSSGRTIHILRAEMPGPVVDKIVPRVKNTAKIFYLIYIVMTLAEVAFLTAGKMPLFESFIHAFGTAGTGGFGIYADSVGGYSPYIQWVICAFMLLFGINFNLYYLVLIRRVRDALRSEELWVYLGIAVTSAAVITLNVSRLYSTVSETIRHSAFQVASILTTTGFSTTDFDLWPGLSKTVLLLLMFIGGCAGSTAGGIKVSRIIILFKSIKSEFSRLLHPRSVNTVRFEGKAIDRSVRTGVGTYFALYIILFAVIFLLISAEPFGMESNFSAVAACFNNIGPGFAAVGPLASYSAYSGFSKIVLSVAMLLGRLEIYPIILSLTPSLLFGKSRR